MLENAQKKCLKIMFGYDLTYTALLAKAGLETLKVRRENALAKFADRMSKIQCKPAFSQKTQ